MDLLTFDPTTLHEESSALRPNPNPDPDPDPALAPTLTLPDPDPNPDPNPSPGPNQESSALRFASMRVLAAMRALEVWEGQVVTLIVSKARSLKELVAPHEQPLLLNTASLTRTLPLPLPLPLPLLLALPLP